MQPTMDLRLAERERPKGPAVMYQLWRSLLFLHWSWDPDEIQRTLPPGLTVDTFEGRAWVGLVPFFMRGVRPALFPAVPGISNFQELNVRTYAFDSQGRPGVWFYSLDANQWLAVKLARWSFHLPYQHAVMFAQVEPSTGMVDYRLQRRGANAESHFHYGPAPSSTPAESAPGSLEFFLVERYRLFAYVPHSKRILSGRVFHRPYPITAASVERWDDLPLRWDSLPSPARPPDHVCFAPGVDVQVFPLA